MKILLIGPQGSGKGTVGLMLGEKLNLPSVSLGQVLRDLPVDHKYKKQISDAMQRGDLAPITETSEIIREELSKPKYAAGYIAEGWGRQITDLYLFDPEFDKVIYLNIPPEVSIKRLSTRRVCENCGRNFNIVTVPPKVEGVCDYCGGRLYQRTDDTPDAITHRLEIFNNKTKEVLEYFTQKGSLVEVDGTGTPQEVLELVLEALNK